MTEPCCLSRKSLTVFLILATLAGSIQAQSRRCLREFDPSNCNASVEAWAFDPEQNKCVEVVYGGCGKPKRFSNRFKSREDCMLRCANVGRRKTRANNDEPPSALENRDPDLEASHENQVDKVPGVFNVLDSTFVMF